jgi:hypothetical protein
MISGTMRRALLLMVACWALGPSWAQSSFDAAEKARIVAYWNAPGRMLASLPPEAAGRGPWQVRLTVEGSRWLFAYQRAAGGATAPPTADPAAAGSEAEWEAWVKARLEFDRWKAQATCDAANAGLRVPPGVASTPAPPPPPGPIPEALLAAAGNPPPLAAAVTPLLYQIAFDDGDSYSYQDHTPVRPRYAYYRFSQGVMALGPMLRDLPAAELDRLFADAGFTPAEQRVARAVSRLEGGLESVNTYDTGFVSVGFIQFAALERGSGSLAEVLRKEKQSWPEEFARDFRAFGVDVSNNGELVALDPNTGAELIGTASVLAVVNDKRLISVFQRAGRRSAAFRAAQIQVAKSRYWPTDDPVRIVLDRGTVTGKVSEVIRSEAGVATLFDRKVNRGSIRPFDEVLGQLMRKYGLRTLAEAAAYERELVAAMKYRADFLADTSLGQPPAAPNGSRQSGG